MVQHRRFALDISNAFITYLRIYTKFCILSVNNEAAARRRYQTLSAIAQVEGDWICFK
ncbi:MAG: hypothetical protein RM049_15290 [Nostoc sp. DedQUE04]|nr:hypothetical protein [Nostoc sp. DedQUE04]